MDANPSRSELSRDVYGLEVHHIYGRGRPEEHDWFCNLIWLSKSEHNHLHDCSPAVMEVECLYAKYLKSLSQLDLDPDPQFMDWNVEALSKICGCVNLLGRLEGILLPKVLKINEQLSWNFDSTVRKCRELIAELTQSA